MHALPCLPPRMHAGSCAGGSGVPAVAGNLSECRDALNRTPEESYHNKTGAPPPLLNTNTQAVALEGRVYQLLEATPQGGREFAKAVREVLAREMTWVDWKKGRVLGESICTTLASGYKNGSNNISSIECTTALSSLLPCA